MIIVKMSRINAVAPCMRLSTASAPPLKLYGFDVSQPTRSILLLCEEAGVDYTYKTLNILVGEHKQEAYMKINPNGTMPTIQDELAEDNVFTLFEGAAMLKYGTFASSHRAMPPFRYPQAYFADLNLYLSTHMSIVAITRGLRDFYPEEDFVARARIDQWMHWHHHATRMGTFAHLRPALLGVPPTENSEEKFIDAMQVLEKALASSPTGFVAQTPTISVADLLLLPELDQIGPDVTNLFDFSAYPHVQQYVSKMQAALPKSYATNVANLKGGIAQLKPDALVQS